MEKFRYIALKDNSEIVEGEIEALDAKDARRKIRALNLVPTKLSTESELLQKSDYRAKGRVKTLSLTQKINFTSELEVLLSSGIPILTSLESIQTNSTDTKLRVVCEDLQNSVKSGKTFAQSLDEYYGRVFGNVYCSLVQTGENSGELEKTLERMRIMLQKQDDIKAKVINALIYPSLLMIMLFALLVLFSKFVFPAFMNILSLNGGELPILARTVMDFLKFISDFWWLILLFIAAGIGFVSTLMQNESIKFKIDNFLLKLKIISDFIISVNTSNFLTVLQISYDAGVPITSALELSGTTVSNLVLKDRAKEVINLMKNGKTLTDAFRISRVIPEALMGMISAGEKSGELGKMLKDAVSVTDKKVDMALSAVMKLIEPAVIIIIGIFVAIVLLAFMQAYAGMLGSLS